MNYQTSKTADKAAMETYLDGASIIYNPDDNGDSTSINPGMNYLLFPSGGYADMSYLGVIPNDWDSNGEPIGWTTEVFSHIASKEDLSGFPTPEPYFPNRFAGEQIPVPDDVETNIATETWTKGQIVSFCEDNLIPHNGSWLKAVLILAVLRWYGLSL